MLRPFSQVKVIAPSRLHITLIDMNGESGRVDGGVGIALSRPYLSISAFPREDQAIVVDITTDQAYIGSDELTTEIFQVLVKVQKSLGLPGVHIVVDHPLPVHSGLGSKTQTLLCASALYHKLHNIHLSTRELARIIARGGTSGIGVEAFTSGGFIVDCGHSFESKGYSFTPSSFSQTVSPAPLVARYDFPNWPILVVIPNARRIHGAQERQLFSEICPIPKADAHHAAHIVLMTLIPSIIENNLQTFVSGIDLIQKLAWKNGEIQAQSLVVRESIDFLRELGLSGIGMSSWGPAIFGFSPQLSDFAYSKDLIEKVFAFLNKREGGMCFLTYARNKGAAFLEIP